MPLVSVAVTLRPRPAALFGTVPVKVRGGRVELSHDGNALPFESVAVYLRPPARVGERAGGKGEVDRLPSFQVWVAVRAATTGAEAGVNTEKVSEADRPLVSVAVTLRPTPTALLAPFR